MFIELYRSEILLVPSDIKFLNYKIPPIILYIQDILRDKLIIDYIEYIVNNPLLKNVFKLRNYFNEEKNFAKFVIPIRLSSLIIKEINLE